jgi:hypothetical protein
MEKPGESWDVAWTKGRVRPFPQKLLSGSRLFEFGIGRTGLGSNDGRGNNHSNEGEGNQNIMHGCSLLCGSSLEHLHTQMIG